MKKYSKKLALILALSLVLAFAIPALAASGSTTIDGTYEEPDIKVSLPTDTTAIINPYGLPVDITEEGSTTVVATMEGSQIVAAKPLAGYNYGKVDLDIGATVVGTSKGDFKLAPEKPDPDSKAKTGLVYFEIKSDVDLGYSTNPDTSYIDGLKISKIVDELNTWNKVAYKESAKDQVIVSTRSVEKPGMATIKAVDTITGLPTADSCFIARLSGDIVKAPTGGWTSSDGVEVKITWILEPTPKD